MSRRRLLQGSGAAGVGLLVGCGRLPWQGSPPRMVRVGILANVGLRDGASVTAITDALREEGYVEGESLTIEFHSSEGKPERLPAYASELARVPVNVILAAGPPAVRTALDAMQTIPVVMQYTGDPVADGIVASLAHPGGNVTGVRAIAPQLAGKRVELLKAVLPDLLRLAVLNVTVRGLVGLPELESAAKVLGIRLQVLAVEIDQLEAAFDAMVAD
jgi:putative ABC transport system substrate-binding protein